MYEQNETGDVPLSERTYNFLREKIISNEYIPGSPIFESKIIKELGVSRTPVREAIQRLEQEKLVQIFPKRGAFVTQIPIRTVKEMFEIRELIEPFVTSKVVENMTQSTLDAIDKIEEKLVAIKEGVPMKAAAARSAGRELDDLIFSAFANETLIGFMKGLRTQMDRGCALVGGGDGNIMVLLEQHLGIIEAIRSGDAKKAGNLVEEHLRYAKKNLLLS